ncbi:hypothetical protein Trydic_g1389 [Trypoxylus dichotomus]
MYKVLPFSLSTEHQIIDWTTSKKTRLLTTFFKLGETIVEHPPLVGPLKIIIPLLHIKLGHMKNLVKRTDTNRPAFKHLQSPPFNEAKIKENVSVELWIKQLFRDSKIKKLLQDKEKQVWKMFRRW